MRFTFLRRPLAALDDADTRLSRHLTNQTWEMLHGIPYELQFVMDAEWDRLGWLLIFWPIATGAAATFAPPLNQGVEEWLRNTSELRCAKTFGG